MTCSAIREYLFAFLDSELDAPLSIEVQRHIERCHDCAREAETERAIRQHLARALETGGTEGMLNDAALEHAVRRATGRVRWLAASSRRARLITGIAAALVLVPLIGFAWRSGWGRHSDAPFATVLVSDFEHFVSTGQPVQLTSDDAQTVTEWLRSKTQLPVTLASAAGGRCKLVGGRKCEIGGQPAAFAVYRSNGQPISLVAVPGGVADFAGMQRVERAGHSYWVDRCQGHAVVASPHGDLVYACVSTLDEEELLHLMVETMHGDG
ncbi:MAG: zf-HC2 domain-containing protein [Planctomycetota bacterium]